ncbi:MAG: hypothetical protein R3195_15970, partial [Gemmatimonadota bacterium]|nr:hypothetical protein [Gemmatimonadota bacterium]
MSSRVARSSRLVPLVTALLAVLVFPALAGAQSVSERAAEAASALEYRELGPSVMGGRVADIAVVESDPRIFYVGLGA